MSHRAKHSARVRGRASACRASRGLSGASWLILLGLGCSDADATPAYSYPFDPNAEMPPSAPVDTVTNVAPNQPADIGADEADRSDDVNATGGVGGNGGVGGTGTAGAGIGAMGGLGGVGGSPGLGGAAGGMP